MRLSRMCDVKYNDPRELPRADFFGGAPYLYVFLKDVRLICKLIRKKKRHLLIGLFVLAHALLS